MSSGNKSSPDGVKVGFLSEICSSVGVTFQLDLVTESAVRVGQSYALHEFLLAKS